MRPIAPAVTPTRHTAALGSLLYTHYIYAFQAAGLILLVAMIGAIVLTLRDRPGVKRQDISIQNARTQGAAVELRQVPTRGTHQRDFHSTPTSRVRSSSDGRY